MVALSRDEYTAILRPTVQATGLPNRAYRSSDWARLEASTAIGGHWFCLGFVSDVPINGLVPVIPLGVPLLLVRDGTGTIRTFHNVCRHRGHRLVSEPGPLKQRISCPYHRWSYSPQGDLVGTPHVGGPQTHECDAFDRSKAPLFGVRTEIWLDMIFVNLSGDAPSLDACLRPLRERWERFVGPGGLERFHADAPGKFRLEINANWKLAVENYCESYHLPMVHPGLNQYSRLEDHYPIESPESFAGQGTYAFTYNDMAGVKVPLHPAWPCRERKIAEYVAWFPNVLLGLQCDHLFAMVLEPLAPNKTREHTQLYFVGDGASGSEYAEARQSIATGWRDVFLEDVSVVEGMQAGRESPAFDGGVFSPVMDGPTHTFHRWVAAATQKVSGLTLK